MNKSTYFPLADWPKLDEFRALNSNERNKQMVRAKWTGEKRCPKKGEWYLSGAIIEAYRAFNDLSTEFHIAKLVHVKVERVERIIEISAQR